MTAKRQDLTHMSERAGTRSKPAPRHTNSLARRALQLHRDVAHLDDEQVGRIWDALTAQDQQAYIRALDKEAKAAKPAADAAPPSDAKA